MDLFQNWAPTFETYLSETVGRQFNITFRMIYLDFNTIYSAARNKDIDLMFSNPSIYACVEREHQASLVASLLNLRKGFELDRYYGAFITRYESNIYNISEIKDNIVEAVSISGLGACQLQWEELILRGHDFLSDPKQIIFSKNQKKIVKDVIAGVADIGMVRTDLVEGMAADGEIDISDVRFLEDESDRIHPGFPFPFTTTTAAPEWPLGALPWMDWKIAKAVSDALFALNRTHPAAIAGQYSTWKTPLSYFGLHRLQERLEWIDSDGKCVLSPILYDSVVCPTGQVKKNRAIVNSACDDAGLPCPITNDDLTYECLCRPCQKVPDREVDVVVMRRLSDQDGEHKFPYKSCDKMVFCAHAQISDIIEMEVVDAWFEVREALGLQYFEGVEYKWHGASEEPEWVVLRVTGESAASTTAGKFAFNFTTFRRGSALLEIRTCVHNEEDELSCTQIPESPILLEIVDKVCLEAHKDSNPFGECVCVEGFELDSEGRECHLIGNGKGLAEKYVILLAIGAATFLLLVFGGVLFYFLRVEKKQDWLLPRSEIKYSDPPEVLGQGTFGLVVVAVFRNTEVAVKRVMPSRIKATADIDGSTFLKPHSIKAKGKETVFEVEMNNLYTGSVDGPSTQVGYKNLPLKEVNRTVNHMNSSSNVNELQLQGSHAGSITTLVKGRTSSNVSRISFKSEEVKWHSRMSADFKREIKTMVFLRHPNIVTVMGVVMDGKGDALMVMERMKNGSLYDLIHNTTMQFDGEVVMRILTDVVAGMIFLHSSQPPVLHNDLKSGNVLVDESFHSKIADFGLSAKRRASGLLGTPYWMAPELLQGESATVHSEVYAFGVTMFEVFTRSEPYSDVKMPFEAILAAVAYNEEGSTFRPTLPEGLPAQVKELITACWAPQPNLRPNFVMIQKAMAAFDLSEVDDWMSNHFVGKFQAAGTKRTATQLLYDVFPPKIARTLRAGQKVEPEHHACVTIFFSDIVGFTDISMSLPPVQVMAMLDRLYHNFDELARVHDIFKVETIGDAYMAVANLIKEQPQHTRNIAEFSIAAICTANATLISLEAPELGGVNIRVGFHSGP
eukprot:CAMPEP_0196572604 /NCGR_PEP_ID=MMETSP1081-20130531/2618_1 /TAXON_ID=36882 /ORGANISM="Pyramimonas amylifera, Strain CCMP720" /LENGTH=1072 /DNA_ID=CAMNT_0041889967 /DNA_START=195 /DNA_END=3410 /DNA_ORIENTATION=-